MTLYTTHDIIICIFKIFIDYHLNPLYNSLEDTLKIIIIYSEYESVLFITK